MALYLFRKSFFPSDRVWLNMTLGIWNCFWSHKNYFWRREDAYDIDYTNIHSRAHSSLNWDMLFSINISLFAYVHFTWQSNTPLLTSSKLDLETACYCWVRTFSTTILRFTGYGYFQSVHINFAMNKETINQPAKAKRIYKKTLEINVVQIITYNTNNIEYFYEVVYWFLLA